MVGSSETSSSSWDVAIDSSNIGFKLLKKQGWKEGTGLGISQQGILVPLQPELKNNRRGLGSIHTTKRKAAKTHSVATDSKQVAKKTKKLSKKMRKMIEHEKHLQEKEFERAFFREFWPDNLLHMEKANLHANKPTDYLVELPPIGCDFVHVTGKRLLPDITQ
ncbi:hypothetical protein Bca4012_009626 [Brassica carinata]